MDFFSILKLVGGLALFLYGMDTMGDGLKKLAGGKLESILAKLTSNRFKSFLLGLFVTVAIQSSSATIVMLVGFVNSGIMRLGQTLGAILGANLGTTITAWILSLTGISGDSFFLRLLKPESFTPILAIIGIIMMTMSTSERKQKIGVILMGFAVLMFGMETMGGAMSGEEQRESIGKIFVMFSNPIMGILIGTVLTALIQSSSASVGILQALALTVAIPYSTAIPIILGQNLGAAITPLLASLNANSEAKKVSMSNLYIKLIGIIIVGTVFYILNSVFNFAFMSKSVNVVTIAVVHTLFNIISTVILLPFCTLIEKLANLTIKSENEEASVFDTLDDSFLSFPAFAVEQCDNLVKDMFKIASDSVISSTSLLNNYDEEKAKVIMKNEKLVDKYEDKTGAYLVKLAGSNVSMNHSKKITELLHVIGDVERISDHSVNIAKVALEIHDKHVGFSPKAEKEIGVITKALCDILKLTVDAFTTDDMEKAKYVEPLEQVIDRLNYKIKNNHVKRLGDGECTVEMGFILSDLLTNYSRVSDHCSNVAVYMLGSGDDSFESHEYLSHVKNDGENEFFELYENYKAKYSL